MGKNIVICCDGTWNEPSQRSGNEICPSNVVKIALAVEDTDKDGNLQLVHYVKGVGTEGVWDRLTGGAFGVGLSENVLEAYSFLINNYSIGDRIFCFGFSRGAYTARSLSGLINKCGILKHTELTRLTDAYNFYKQYGIKSDSDKAKEYRNKYAIEETTPMEFLGVWDTVGALGIPLPIFYRLSSGKFRFHDTELSANVNFAYHALAVDEKRRLFEATLWKTDRGPEDGVEQVWFAGVHSNIGGGYPDHRLSDIAFDWIKDKSVACGLALDVSKIEPPIDASYQGEVMNSRKSFYKLYLPFHRPIFKGGIGNQKIHSSVVEKFAAQPTYRPLNIIKAIDENTPLNICERKEDSKKLIELAVPEKTSLRRYVNRRTLSLVGFWAAGAILFIQYGVHLADQVGLKLADSASGLFRGLIAFLLKLPAAIWNLVSGFFRVIFSKPHLPEGLAIFWLLVCLGIMLEQSIRKGRNPISAAVVALLWFPVFYYLSLSIVNLFRW